MEFKLLTEQPAKDRVLIIDNVDQLKDILNAQEASFLADAVAADHNLVTINRYDCFLFIYTLKEKKTDWQTHEACRKAGAELSAICNKYKIAEISIANHSTLEQAGQLLAEGMSLASYQFLKYKSDAEKLRNALSRIAFAPGSANEVTVNKLSAIQQAVFKARDLVNEPLNALGAIDLANAIQAIGAEAGITVTTLHKEEIEARGMGGLLAVNRGSIDPPTFTISEYKPANAVNQKPIVLVGKGIVYDTGGLSLKPTPNSMDRMKSDMSGAALVSCALFAIAKLQLPLHIIALVPATDNRPGENAYTPGDVITMMSGKKVEVLNTDAEGRMILGDALHYAKQYAPELVLDFATLTGAASAAVGEHGIVVMGTAGDDVKNAFAKSGFRQYERLVEYPLWDEYGEQIKSDIADIKNVGGATGGAITAGKFLEHFTDYPWMHFDIAGVSFNTSKKGYVPSGGTAFGLRMLVDFLENYTSVQ